MELRRHFVFIIILILAVANCRSSNNSVSLPSDDDFTVVKTGVITPIRFEDQSSQKQVSQDFQSDITAYITNAHELRNFSLAQQGFFEQKVLRLVNITSHAELFYSDYSSVSDGCYNIIFLSVPSNYKVSTYLFIGAKDDPIPDMTNFGDTFFAGELCIEGQKIVSIKNKEINSKTYEFTQLLNYFNSIGLKRVERAARSQLNLTFKKLDFNIQGKKYTAQEQTVVGSQRHVLLNLPNGKSKWIFIPLGDDIGRWVKKKTNQKYLVDLGENTYLSSSLRVPKSTKSYTKPTAPLDRAKVIASSYSDDFAEVRSRFKREPGTGTPSGSSNVVQFGKVDGLEDEFVYRTVKNKSQLSKEDFDRFKNEHDILEVLAVANLSADIGGKNGRTLIPQPLSMADDGVSSISQKLYPLTEMHMQFGAFSFDTLRTQLRSMAETIQFLHKPKKIGGKYYSISHRDLKPENFLQQSSLDPRAATTDFDLSEMIVADNLQDLQILASQRRNYVLSGSPITLDRYRITT